MECNSPFGSHAFETGIALESAFLSIYGIHEKRKEYNPFILTCSSLIFFICYLQIFQDLGGSVLGGLSLWKGQSGFTPS